MITFLNVSLSDTVFDTPPQRLIVSTSSTIIGNLALNPDAFSAHAYDQLRIQKGEQFLSVLQKRGFRLACKSYSDLEEKLFSLNELAFLKDMKTVKSIASSRRYYAVLNNLWVFIDSCG